ncbi:MAG: VWA-like domain-containing protein [Actinomycetota bacterium]|nr:VWA-like domain-containing protein [Actinomycetota bacterium]
MVAADRTSIAAARLWAANRYPYLATVLFAPPVVVQEGIGTVSIDPAWRLHLDPEVIADWTVPELGAVLVHHGIHLLRDHADRARQAGVVRDDATGPDGGRPGAGDSDDEAAADSERWLAASDAEINDDLPDARALLPGSPHHPDAFGLDDGQLAESYLAHLRREGVVPERWLDCGGAVDGAPRDWEGSPDRKDCSGDGDGDERGEPGDDADDGAEGDADGLSETARDHARRRAAAEIRQHAKEAGDVPESLRRWADELLGARVDWRRVLAAEIRRGVANVVGAVDYSYARPSRRSSISPDVVLPSLRHPVPELAVVADTSGSMDGAALSAVLGELDGILRGVGVRRGGVRLITCDAAVHDVSWVRGVAGLELTGGGGTDMAVGIAHAAGLRPRPDVIVVLTDGLTPWPDAPPPGTTVIVGLIARRYGAAPPPWARTVLVDLAA